MKDNNIRALIFDMDGVLLDSEPFHLLSYQEILSEYGINYTESDNREFLGRKDLLILETMRARYGLDKPAHLLLSQKEAILARLIKQHSTPNPGLITVLENARSLGVSMAVASSATLPTIELVVDVLFIRSYFQHLISGDEVEEGKPAPDIFLLASSRLGIEPQQCLVIEDSLNGIKAAKAAGMYCISIPCNTTRHQDHSLADRQLTSLEELKLNDWCRAILT